MTATATSSPPPSPTHAVGLTPGLRLVGGTMTHGVHTNGDHSFFTIDVDFPVALLELPASAMTAGETESGDCR